MLLAIAHISIEFYVKTVIFFAGFLKYTLNRPIPVISVFREEIKPFRNHCSIE